MPKAESEKLTLRLVALEECRLWDKNPKVHSIPKLMESIRRYGFVDPPHYDAALDALVYGNGRAEALAQMAEADEDPPRGISVDKAGRWRVPILFGLDQASRAQAEALAIDHNTLTLGEGFDDAEAAKLYDPVAMAGIFERWSQNGDGDDWGDLVFPVGGLFDANPLGEMPMLPTGDRSPFQQMTFTVSDEQAEAIKAALAAAKSQPFGETGNDNSNGNALARIAEAYRG